MKKFDSILNRILGKFDSNEEIQFKFTQPIESIQNYFESATHDSS